MRKVPRHNRRREPKIAEMDRQGWKSLLRVTAVFVVSCGIAVALPYLGYLYYVSLESSGKFSPKHVSIRGNVRVSDAEILKASGLMEESVNLVEVNRLNLRAGIETLPWVKEARVAISLPDAVEIEVVERQPLGVVNDRRLVIVDDKGEFIKIWMPNDGLMTPVLSTEQPLDGRPEVIKTAFGLVEIVEQMGYPHRVEEVHYDDATGYTIFTTTSEVRLGYDRFEERIERLMVVDALLSSRDIVAAYILLDAENDLDRVIIKPYPKSLSPKEEVAEPELPGSDSMGEPSAMP
ncbi:MAG: FtsQ-type POTRA domain-containing protein [Proteobacteria bacterium]|nr:FtsQ-type POTRA domain-containing protein [Pseudomonadota bacterium]